MEFGEINLSGRDLISEGDKYIDFYQFPGEEDKGIRVFCKNEKDNYEFIKNSYFMNNLSYEKGVRVPKPYGIVKVNLDGESFFGIVVQKLKGKTLDNLFDEEFEDARDSWFKAVIKANYSGFSCNDSSRKQNAFWVPEEKKTYLLDSDFWKYQGVGWGDN